VETIPEFDDIVSNVDKERDAKLIHLAASNAEKTAKLDMLSLNANPPITLTGNAQFWMKKPPPNGKKAQMSSSSEKDIKSTVLTSAASMAKAREPQEVAREMLRKKATVSKLKATMRKLKASIKRQSATAKRQAKSRNKERAGTPKTRQNKEPNKENPRESEGYAGKLRKEWGKQQNNQFTNWCNRKALDSGESIFPRYPEDLTPPRKPKYTPEKWEVDSWHYPGGPVNDNRSYCRMWWNGKTGPGQLGQRGSAKLYKNTFQKRVLRGASRYLVGLKYGCTKVVYSKCRHTRWSPKVQILCGCYEIWCPHKDYILANPNDKRKMCFTLRRFFGCFKGGKKKGDFLWVPNCMDTGRSKGPMWELMVF